MTTEFTSDRAGRTTPGEKCQFSVVFRERPLPFTW